MARKWLAAQADRPTTSARAPTRKIPLVEIGHYFDCIAPFMKLQVVVMPKQSVLDPQGVAVKNAVRDLGLDTVEQVRVGKFLELHFTNPPDPAKLEEICRDLLSNPVIEDYTIQYP